MVFELRHAVGAMNGVSDYLCDDGRSIVAHVGFSGLAKLPCPVVTVVTTVTAVTVVIAGVAGCQGRTSAR